MIETSNEYKIPSIKLSTGFDEEVEQHFLRSELEGITPIVTEYYYKAIEESVLQNMPNDIFLDMYNKTLEEYQRRKKLKVV